VRELIRLIRPRHWLKNVFVFAPLLFSLNLFVTARLLHSALCFIAFCLATSFIYILNDYVDREADRKHPVKKNRPLAAGTVSLTAAAVLAAVFLVGSLAISFILDIRILVVTAAYVALNVLYSFYVKNIVILDVFSIAAGFVLRIFAGSFAIAVPISNWILLCTLSISLFIGFGKRRHDLAALSGAKKQRAVLQEYSLPLLDYMMVISATLTCVTYSLWVADPQTALKLKSDRLMLTIPFVLYGICKYLYIIYKKNGGGDPAEVVSKDIGIIVTGVLWVLSMVGLLYLGNARIF
jgi:4-hydroxybenzoate polyprenyltransferase